MSLHLAKMSFSDLSFVAVF